MTPEFEKRLEEASYAYDIPSHRNCMGCCQSDSDYINAFQSGARWAYQQGIRDAVEKLRSDEEIIHLEPCGCCMPDPEKIADYLEEQFKRDGVKNRNYTE